MNRPKGIAMPGIWPKKRETKMSSKTFPLPDKTVKKVLTETGPFFALSSKSRTAFSKTLKE